MYNSRALSFEASDMNKLAIDIEKRQFQSLSNPDLAASAGIYIYTYIYIYIYVHIYLYIYTYI
jgi:hypothetical protein